MASDIASDKINSKSMKVTEKIWRVAKGEETRQAYQKREADKLKRLGNIPESYLSPADLKLIEAILGSPARRIMSYAEIRYSTGYSYPHIKDRVERMEKEMIISVNREGKKKKAPWKYSVEVTKYGIDCYRYWKEIHR